MAKANKITIILEGGLVQGIQDIPPGVVVRVRDYDTEGCDESQLERDRDGDLYYESIWTHDDSAPDGGEP